MTSPQSAPASPSTPAVPHRGSTVAGFLIGFLLAALIASLVFMVVRLRASDAARLDMSRPTVVRQIQQLRRLETVVYGVDKIVAGGQESRYLPQFLAGERLLLMVYGEVTAGVDLEHLDPSRAVIDGRSITVSLPATEVFSTRIDNERTRVYSRETGLFTSADPDLESDLRREAERQIRDAAIAGGVLDIAAASARATISSFLSGLGFEHVDVREPSE